MRFVVVLCVVLLTFTIVTAKKNKQNGEEKSTKKVFKECQKNEETKVESSVLKKIKKHKQVDLPDNYGDHKLCVMKGIGFINEDNTVNEDNLKKKVTKKVQNNQDIDTIVSECKVAKATPKETAIHIETCLNSHGIEV